MASSSSINQDQTRENKHISSQWTRFGSIISDAEVAEGKTMKAKQKEVIHRYAHRETFQDKVTEIQSETGVAEKTAKTPISETNLYKAQRAVTVYKLFGKTIGSTT
ncbi:2423_t:CDS:2, partial [Ambispora gerdemannii]